MALYIAPSPFFIESHLLSWCVSQKMRTKFETDAEGNYKSADDVQDKKITYTTVVVGLIVIAFVAPMIQFFYYTGGE